MASFVRSTGSLNLIYPIYYTLHKLVRNWGALLKPDQKYKSGCCPRCRNFNQGVKFVYFMILLLGMILVIPAFTITVWKPYEMYCLSRLNTYAEVPTWCYNDFPNLYDYVQKTYW